MRALCCLLLTCLATSAAAAEVYRWVDENKVVHYGDKPPTKDAKPANLPPIQVMSGGAPAAATPGIESTPKPPSPPPALPISIVAPLGDQTIRTADRQITVKVSLAAPLPEGGGLVYFLDGNRKNAQPVRALSYAIDEVDRGSHLVEVAALDAKGKELGRAAPVIVHMRPPGGN